MLPPELPRKGHGSLPLQGAEAAVRAKGARMLLVDTAGRDEFEGVRAFYRVHGYAEEARVRSYYGEGADKVLVRRVYSPG